MTRPAADPRSIVDKRSETGFGRHGNGDSRKDLLQSQSMRSRIRRWIPLALCCAPGVVGATIVAFGIAAGEASFGAPVSLGLIAAALIASLAAIARVSGRRLDPTQSKDKGRPVSDCCLPAEAMAPEFTSAAERLAELQELRRRLEREVDSLQGGKSGRMGSR